MNLPDIKGMTDREFIMWICGAVLVYLLLMNPLAISHKLDTMGELQAQMVREHTELLAMAQVQCVNLAELVPDGKVRARQLERCLTRKIEVIERGV